MSQPLAATVSDKETTLEIPKIRTDGGTQPRAALNQDTIEEYAQEMKAGAKFPPVVVFYDGTDYWLADGFHRLEAAKNNSSQSIEVEIRQGTRRDAVLFSVGANAKHGLRRTSADKRRAIVTLLSDGEWCLWSNNQIAGLCGVYDTLVATVRQELSSRIEKIDALAAKKYGIDEQTLKEAQKRVQETPTNRRKVQRGGTEYTVNTSKIGQYKKKETPATSSVNSTLSKTPSAKEDTESPPRVRQTILALHKKTPPENLSEESATSAIAQPTTETQKENSSPWRQLGKHWLFNGHPTAEEFQERIELEDIAYSVILPPWSERDLEAPDRTKAFLKFAAEFSDLDWATAREMLRHGFEIASESGDLVAIYFLPHPQILTLADLLGCCCLIAEPNRALCDRAIEAWKTYVNQPS